jgi:hypothetical protein
MVMISPYLNIMILHLLILNFFIFKSMHLIIIARLISHFRECYYLQISSLIIVININFIKNLMGKMF